MRQWFTALLAILLAGCATPGGQAPDGKMNQAARERLILGREAWALRGRIAVSDGEDGGSARINWDAGPNRYELWIYAPLAQGTWRLEGDSESAVLAGPEGTFRGTDAQSLLIQHLGWHLPVTGLRYWVRGLEAPGPVGAIEFDAKGRLAVLEQDGWTVTYTDWSSYPELDMPRRIEAEFPPYQVKLVVQDWALRESSAGPAD